nr:MAG TPA: hypothetical protein [Caudoviricetes sp.]
MRNPMNSWAKSDSHYCWEPQYPGGGCFGCELNSDHNCRVDKYVVGAADLDLMKRLIKSGTDHSKFLRMIGVTCDLTAPLYWWKEYDTYKVGTVANSCSTMHKIHAKKFEREDFSTDHLIPRMKEVLDVTIANLNACRGNFLETQDKKWWWQMIQLLPTSYNQKRTVQLNYAVLRNIYHSRKNHKLDEWHTFCHWVEGLPYSELITM